MTDQEFELLDELYFVTSFQDLINILDWDSSELKVILESLLEQGWIKALKSPDGDVIEEVDVSELNAYYFLATKEGLMMHNRA